MKKKWFLAVGLLLALAIVGVAGCSPGNTLTGEIGAINISNQQEGIWVTGQGEVTVVPDIATLSLGIAAQEVSVAEAQAQAMGAMEQVMTALTDNGVAEKDIQTQYFSIYQVTRWDNGKEEEIVIGYRVTNMVIAKIRDVDKTGALIDAVAEAGGDLTRIDSIGFSIDDPSDYYEEARKKAMADAEAKAGQLAELAGITLGKPTYISENIQVPPIYQRGVVYKEALPAATPISPGELEVSLSLQVAYAILK